MSHWRNYEGKRSRGVSLREWLRQRPKPPKKAKAPREAKPAPVPVDREAERRRARLERAEAARAAAEWLRSHSQPKQHSRVRELPRLPRKRPEDMTAAELDALALTVAQLRAQGVKRRIVARPERRKGA